VADISSARLPFACVAADLISGKQYVFRNGDIRTAVMASSAIPGFLPPVSYNGALLTDGSVVNNIPITVARQMGADIIIAVDVSLEFESEAPVENVVEVVMRAAQMTGHRLNTVLVKEADVLIEPPIGRFHWTEFERFKELIDLGEKATENKMDEIRQIIKERNSFWYRLFHRGERKE
jgi:NTE family protein